MPDMAVSARKVQGAVPNPIKLHQLSVVELVGRLLWGLP